MHTDQLVSLTEFVQAYVEIRNLLDSAIEKWSYKPENWPAYDGHVAVMHKNRAKVVVLLAEQGETRADARVIITELIEVCEAAKSRGEGSPYSLDDLKNICAAMAERFLPILELWETLKPQNEQPQHVEHYVTLDKAAAIVNRSKRTLEKRRSRCKNPLPEPDVEGGGGKPNEWKWPTIRPWLEEEFGKKLPIRFPGAMCVKAPEPNTQAHPS